MCSSVEPQLIDDMALVSPGFFSFAIIVANGTFVCDCFRKWIIPFAIVFANESSFAITIANESFVAKTFANQKPHYIAIRKLIFDIHSHSLS